MRRRNERVLRWISANISHTIGEPHRSYEGVHSILIHTEKTIRSDSAYLQWRPRGQSKILRCDKIHTGHSCAARMAQKSKPLPSESTTPGGTSGLPMVMPPIRRSMNIMSQLSLRFFKNSQVTMIWDTHKSASGFE